MPKIPGTVDVPESVTPPAEPAVVMDSAVNAQLVAMVEKLLDRIDKGENEAVSLFREVLEKHGEQLKQTLSPENRLHPDVSDYNPLGERDNPRPALTRPWFFLGVPLDRQTLTYAEIDLLNSFKEAREMPAPTGSGKWRVAFLSDGGGGQSGYISVPFRSFDDLRGIEGGWQRVCRDLLGLGQQPATNDTLMARIQALEAQLKALASMPVVAVPPSATEEFDPDK